MPYETAKSTPYHRTPPWDRPLTAKQAYWLQCVAEACAEVQTRTGRALPATFHAITKADQRRHHGVSSTTASNVTATLAALADRRWIEIGTMPPELMSGDRRCSNRAYRLADRAAITDDTYALAKARAEREKLSRIMAKTRENLTDPRFARASDEVDYARQRQEMQVIDSRISSLVERIDTHCRAAPTFDVDVPPELIPANVLLAACERKATAPTTQSPYAD